MDRRALLGLAAVAAALPASASGAAGGSAPANSYLPLPTATATVLRRDGRRGVMTVETGVDAPDAALRARVQASQPRLNAAYAAVVQRTAAVLLPGAPPDIDALGRALQAATDTVLGRPGARVLLGTVMIV